MKYQKHKNLIKRNTGNYAPNEISVLGTNCTIIGELVQKIAEKLQKRHKIAYFDASHDFDKKAPLVAKYTFNKNGFVEKKAIQTDNHYQLKILFNAYDLVFINGNHYQATQQILILDSNKKTSVLKRLKHLNNIQFVVKLEKNSPYFDFLLKEYPTIKNLKCYTITQIDAISKHIENIIKQKIATVNGLILIGGKSTRMGTDKSNLQYYGKPQREHLLTILSNTIIKNNIYFSVRNKDQLPNETQIITDKFLNLGPFGGICSAFMHNPNAAWLVVATDLPFIDNSVIKLLLSKRNPTKIATAFIGKNNEFPEPLITIYEPKAYPILLNYLTQGYSCPRKVLINNDVEIIEINTEFIKNVNTKQDYQKTINKLSEINLK